MKIRMLKPVFVMVVVLTAGIFSCQKINIVTTTTTATNLVGYMEKDPATYSEFLKIIERSGTSSYLNAYGAYTLFAPNNAAVKTYLQLIGKTSVEEIDPDQLKLLVKYHLLSDTIRTPQFTDGKLPVPTMHGEYLITGVKNTDGVSRYVVNRSAVVLTPDVRVGNGILHTTDHVLIPAQKTIAKLLEENTSYSIFTQALKATGYFKTLDTLVYLNDTTARWLTVLAQKDAVFQAAGIASYEALKARYSNLGDPMQPKDSLHLYVGYHILSGLKYVADLVSAPAHETLAPQEVVLTALRGDTLRINEETVAGVFEKGVDVNRNSSDLSATNGVLHDVSAEVYIKVRKPTPVYFDVADQPEIRKLTAKFRKVGNFVTFNLGDLADITWSAGTVTYNCYAPDPTKGAYYWNDWITPSSLRTRAGQNNWIQFKTPVVIKGKYKIWVSYRRDAGGINCQVYFNDVLMPRLINFNDYRYGASTITDEELQSQGWKRYSATAAFNNTVMGCKMVGTADVTTTGRHLIKFVPTGDVGGNTNIDMIHLIPEDMDQFKPRFASDGSLVY